MRQSLLLFALLYAAAQAMADSRVFVSLAGSLLKAEVTAATGENVTLKRADDGQTMVIPRNTLCKEDNAYIERWLGRGNSGETPPPSPAPAAFTAPSAPAQKYRLGCNILPAKSNRGPADGGVRTIEMAYNFIINNQEVTRDLTGAKGIVITLGKNAAESSGDLIILQKQYFDVNIRAQSKMEFSTEQVRLTYSKSPGASVYGVKSYGYALIILDAAGALLFVEASPDSTRRYTKELLDLTEVPCMVDRDFKLKATTPVPMNFISF